MGTMQLGTMASTPPCIHLLLILELDGVPRVVHSPLVIAPLLGGLREWPPPLPLAGFSAQVLDPRSRDSSCHRQGHFTGLLLVGGSAHCRQQPLELQLGKHAVL